MDYEWCMQDKQREETSEESSVDKHAKCGQESFRQGLTMNLCLQKRLNLMLELIAKLFQYVSN